MLLLLRGNFGVTPLDVPQSKAAQEVDGKIVAKLGNFNPELKRVNDPYYPFDLTEDEEKEAGAEPDILQGG